MKALVTGASSGMGRDMAKYLYSLGYELYLVARNKKDLNREVRYHRILKRGRKDISVLPKYYGLVMANYGQGHVYECKFRAESYTWGSYYT